MEYVYAELGFESNTYGVSYFFMTTQLFCISLMVIGCLTYWAWRQYREKQSIRLFYLVEERSRFLDSKFMELRACNPQMDGFQLMCKAVDEMPFRGRAWIAGREGVSRLHGGVHVDHIWIGLWVDGWPIALSAHTYIRDDGESNVIAWTSYWAGKKNNELIFHYLTRPSESIDYSSYFDPLKRGYASGFFGAISDPEGWHIRFKGGTHPSRPPQM